METGPEVLVEDPMTQRLVLAGEVAVDDPQQPEMADVIQVPPPVYTIKDQHLEFENDPPPPSFRDVVPSSSFSPLSPFLHKPKPSRRKPSRSSSSGSQSNTSTTEQHRLSRHQIFRYRPASTDINNSNVSNDNDNDNNNAAEPVSTSESSVRRPAATAVEPTVIRIHNVARWVAESRRDTFQTFAGSSSSSSEHPSFSFVSADANPDTYCDNSEPYGSSSSSSSSSTAGNMRILTSMGVLYPSVIVHM